MNKVLCMSAMILNEFVNCTNLLESQILASNDVAIEFKGTTSNVKDQKWNPPNGLIRHQLVELLVRLALRKKTKLSSSESIPQAVDNFFETQIGHYI